MTNPEYLKGQQNKYMSLILTEIPLCKLCKLDTVRLVTLRKDLSSFPMPGWVKLVLRACLGIQRWAFFRYGWAASRDKTDLCKRCAGPNEDVHSIEYKGVYTDPADAYWEANQSGGTEIELPLNASTPDGTCTFRDNLSPATPPEVRTRYQHQTLDLVAVPRQELAMLGRKIEEVERCAAGECDESVH